MSFVYLEPVGVQGNQPCYFGCHGPSEHLQTRALFRDKNATDDSAFSTVCVLVEEVMKLNREIDHELYS